MTTQVETDCIHNQAPVKSNALDLEIDYEKEEGIGDDPDDKCHIFFTESEFKISLCGKPLTSNNDHSIDECDANCKPCERCDEIYYGDPGRRSSY